MNGHRIGVAAVVVMLALSGGVAAAAITSPSTADSTVAQTDGTPTTLQELNASVAFDDQTTSNATVTVQNVTLSEGGYVAVHATTGQNNETVGAVVGVSDYLEPGTHQNVTVTLYEDVPGATFENTSLSGTQTFVAMAHQETSANATDNGTDTNTTTTTDNATTTTDDNTTTTEANETTTAGENTTTTEDNTTTTTETTATTTTTTTDGGDDNTTNGNATGVFGAVQQDSPTFDFLTSNGEEDGPYLVDGQPVTDSAQVTFADDSGADDGDGGAPGQGDDGATDDDGAAAGALSVGNLSAPEYVTPGSNVTVNATVTNDGSQTIEESVAFRLQGGSVDLVLRQDVSVDAGETTNVTFEVNTTDVPEREYIHGVTTENSSAFAQLTVTNDSAVVVADQNATTNVTVEDVFVPEGGYVAVHNSNALDAPVESVVGASDYLEAGYHENVTVTLYDDVAGADFQNDSVSDAQTFVAMTHQETSGNATDGNATNTFDFVTSDGDEDGPYLVGGQPVVDTAIVMPDDAEGNATA